MLAAIVVAILSSFGSFLKNTEAAAVDAPNTGYALKDVTKASWDTFGLKNTVPNTK